jgi:tetratricopeptide (TPR) repeat protein
MPGHIIHCRAAARTDVASRFRHLLYAFVAAFLVSLLPAISSAQPSDIPPGAPDVAIPSLAEVEQAVRQAQREATPVAIEQADSMVRSAVAFSPADEATLAYHRGQVLELQGRALESAEHYQRALELDPSGRRARHARNRLRQVTRVELAAPEDSEIIMEFAELRASWQSAGSTATIERATALLDRVQSPWLKADILIWLGMSWHHGLHDAEKAWQWYRQAAEVTPLTRQQANSSLSGMVAVSAEAGRVFQTGRIVDAWVAAHPDVIPDLELTVIHEEYQDQLGNRVATQFSRVVLPLFLLTFLVTRSWRALRWRIVREWKPWGPLAFIAWIFGAAAVIGASWAPNNLYYLLVCIPAVSIVFIMSGAMARSMPRRTWLLVSVSLLSAMATLAALYTALYLVGGTALLGI